MEDARRRARPHERERERERESARARVSFTFGGVDRHGRSRRVGRIQLPRRTADAAPAEAHALAAAGRTAWPNMTMRHSRMARTPSWDSSALLRGPTPATPEGPWTPRRGHVYRDRHSLVIVREWCQTPPLARPDGRGGAIASESRVRRRGAGPGPSAAPRPCRRRRRGSCP